MSDTTQEHAAGGAPAPEGAAHGSAGHDDTHGDHHGGDHHGVGHVVSMKILVGIWLALMALTALTVYAAQFKFGPMEVVVAMVIATIKGGMVCLYFMHLRYDKPFHGFVFVSALAFVSLFISIALMDAGEYAPQIEELEQQKPPVFPSEQP